MSFRRAGTAHMRRRAESSPPPKRSLAAPKTLEESLKKTVEERLTMKNIILITTLAMLTGAIALKPLTVQAQSTVA
jgi:hypothetical protein